MSHIPIAAPLLAFFWQLNCRKTVSIYTNKETFSGINHCHMSCVSMHLKLH
ncbi:hypothetical protein PAUR_a1738 [Pseudoalteromonas aurantia 208]|uniref:Orphan protein n=1 Tax=Pseudoalteromonas aurantia 208 TaxID=1314867 RepID=A0ABR9EB19_9GAMM|nr:hypothetical protein [Pseudoalteromonas aurantia 208]